jgi:hypothetical protein
MTDAARTIEDFFRRWEPRHQTNVVTTMTKHNARAPLRLVLVTDGRTIPNWLFKSLEQVEQSGAAQCALVLRATHEVERGSLRFVQRLRQFLFWLYQNVDRRLFHGFPDAHAPIDLQFALPNCRILDGADQLQKEQIDAVLDPFSLLPDGSLAEASTYGVWSTTFGQSGDPRTQSTPAFWEVIEGIPSTETRLCIHRQGFSKKLSLYVSVAPTDHRSVSRSQNHIYWKMSAALARSIQRLWEDPGAFLKRLKAAAPFDATNSPSLVPGNLDMVRAATSLMRRYVSDRCTSALYREQWALGYRHGMGDQLAVGTFQQLIPPSDRYWADPFPLQVGNDYYIFHEELRFSTGKGSIVLTVMDDTSRTARPIPILERDYHLSYPFVFQWDGEFFMIPQTASHQVELYRCVHFPAHWKLERVLLCGLTAFDPTLAFLSGRWWLFANVPTYGAGTTDELHAFHANSPLGPWMPHRSNPIKSDVRSARPAGRIFERGGQFYRPAQDCSQRYGYAVSINRIIQLNLETYQEVEVEKIIPTWGPNVVGVHTFNRAGDMTVIDYLVRTKRGSWARPRQLMDRASADRPQLAAGHRPA